MYHPDLYHPFVEDTARRLRAEAEQERLARRLPRRPSVLRATLAGICYALADRLDSRPMPPPRPEPASA